MPVIKTWCLPQLEQEELERLYEDMSEVVVGTTEFGLSDPGDVTFLFPTDMMNKGLGEEIIVEMFFFERPARTKEVLERVAQGLGEILQRRFPDALVEVFMLRFDSEAEPWWSSRK